MMKRAVLLSLVLLAAVFFRAEAHAARDMAAIAYDITHKDMTPEQWKKFVKKALDRYDTWIWDNRTGNLNRFLNDKLLELAPSVLSGKVKALKNMVYWLALYHELREQPPKYIRDISDAHRKEIDEMLKDWSWERVASRIKKKKDEFEESKKRSDEDQKKKKKEEKKKNEKNKKD